MKRGKPFGDAGRWIRRAFTENLGLKGVALIITSLLFMVVRFQDEVERWIDVSVTLKQPTAAQKLVMTSEAPDSVRVFLRGPRSWVNTARQGDLPAVVMDLSRFREGVSTYYFDTTMFEVPTGLEIVRIVPESVRVRLDRVVARRLPVKVRTVGNLLPGTELLAPPLASPAAVEVSGAASYVRPLTHLETEELDLDGLAPGAHQRKVALERPPEVEVAHKDDVRVSLEVVWTPATRAFEKRPVRVVGTDLPADVSPAEVTVTLAGPEELLKRLDPAQVLPTAKMAAPGGRQPGSSTIALEVEGLPPDLKVKEIVPGTVQVRLGAAWNRGGKAKKR